MSRRTLLLGAWVCLVFLGFLSPTYAETVVNPNEGTIGTTITISGADFGTKKGTVLIGSKPCRVLAWSDTSIEALVRTPMPPGTYDLVLKPKGEAAVVLSGAFTIMEPTLEQPGLRPQFLSAGEVVTWGGAFLGGGNGLKKVEVEDLNGKTRPCRLLEATMDSITFKLPSGIPGEVNLRYTNGVGTAVCPFWGTFAKAPENLPTLMQSYSGAQARDSAAAVSYRNKLWVFYPRPDDDSNRIAYRTWDGSAWTPGVYVVANDQEQKSQTQITPVKSKMFFTFSIRPQWLSRLRHLQSICDGPNQTMAGILFYSWRQIE
jgi:hypothetical protein